MQDKCLDFYSCALLLIQGFCEFSLSHLFQSGREMQGIEFDFRIGQTQCLAFLCLNHNVLGMSITHNNF
jgi:hypothetical protein